MMNIHKIYSGNNIPKNYNQLHLHIQTATGQLKK